ncbi:hypothetical protein DFH28DRAFT_1201179 [Melampsora americana]|nr:hypothetical protein DFH28DRAFT_1201179 [Melampsora americana]
MNPFFLPQNIHPRHLLIIFLASSVLLIVGAQKQHLARQHLLGNVSSSETGRTYDSQQNSPQTPDSHLPRFPLTSLTTLDTGSLASGEYTSIVVFGASWADNAHRRPKKYAGTLRGPPYYQGRYSNGIIWAEYLSSSLLAGKEVPLLDYAYGGAVSDNNLTYTNKPDTKTQLNQYISDVGNGSIDRGDGAVLHFWWIGINQITQIWTDAIKTDSTLGEPEVLARAFRRVDKQINELQAQVTKARQDIPVNKVLCDFFIIPIPPLETVPTFIYQASRLAKKSTTLAEKYVQLIGKLSHRYDQGISRFVSEMQSSTDSTPSGWVKTYDFEGFWRDVIANMSQYQFTVSRTTCLHRVNGKQVPCSHPDEYIYWDSLHPTTAMHQVIANSLLSAIKD